MTARLPNFLHLGPGKAGSTWLHEVLMLHPEVYLTPAKDLYYFSRFYMRGTAWYAAQFAEVPHSRRVVGEVCPDYLVNPHVPKRIFDTLGSKTSLMVTLRDPVDRAFSSYLYLKKHGLAGATFRETLLRSPELLDEGRYGTLLRRYLRLFPRQQLYLATFDDLCADPQGFLDGVTAWLELSSQKLSDDLKLPRLPASSARFVPAAALAQRGADWVRHHDGAALVGRVKRSGFVQRTLYRTLGDDRPSVTKTDSDFVREQLVGELKIVEDEFGVVLEKMWGWP